MMNREVLLGALAGALLPAHARALDGDLVASPGVHLVFHFGNGPLKAGLGVDLRMTKILDFQGICQPREAFSGVGGYLRATWLFTDTVQLAAGVHLAFESEANGWVYDTDLGWTYSIAPSRNHHGVQLGFSFGKFPLDLAIARVGLAFDDDGPAFEGQLGLGARTPGTFNESGGGCIIGRPLRVGGEQRLASFTTGPRRAKASGLDPETSSAFCQAWLEAARAERASVPAFLALARDLERVAAPRSLVRRSVAAAVDEQHHARLCEGLVTRSSGLEVATHAPALPVAPVEDRKDLLMRLALESWHDGCIGEATAARRAERGLAQVDQRKTSRHIATQGALQRIAQDERRHAELAWSVLEHAVTHGGSRVRDAVAAAVHETRAPAEDEETRGALRTDPRTWRELGRLDHEEVLSCHEAVAAQARRRVQSLLDRRTRS